MVVNAAELYRVEVEVGTVYAEDMSFFRMTYLDLYRNREHQ